MAKQTEIMDVATHPEANEYPLPSGLTLRLKPMTGQLYLDYQAKTVGFALKGGSGFSSANQWLATQIFEVIEGDEAKPLDLATLTMGLDFDDAAALNGIINELLVPPEVEDGFLPSGLPIERLKPKAQDFWKYQDALGQAMNTKTGQVSNGAVLVRANVDLAAKMFAIAGAPVTEDWLKAADFRDTARVMTLVGERIAATRQR